jgi:hypothetical protein
MKLCAGNNLVAGVELLPVEEFRTNPAEVTLPTSDYTFDELVHETLWLTDLLKEVVAVLESDKLETQLRIGHRIVPYPYLQISFSAFC